MTVDDPKTIQLILQFPRCGARNFAV